MASPSGLSNDDVRRLSRFTSPQMAEAFFARTVVLVEGISDQLALEALAARRGRNLEAEGISIVPMGGATNIGSFLDLFGPQGFEGARIVRLPIRSPKANAVCERWVGTVRRKCLGHLLNLGRQHLERALRAYVAHYNGARPHRALDLGSPEPRDDPPARLELRSVRRRDILGGLIHEYEPAAA